MKKLLAHAATAAIAVGVVAAYVIDAAAEQLRKPDTLLRDWITWPGVTDDDRTP